MRLILAHAGISDLAWIWREVADPSEPVLRHLLVVAGRRLRRFSRWCRRAVLMASDAPYGTPVWAALMAARNALQAGLDADQIRGVLGGQALRS